MKKIFTLLTFTCGVLTVAMAQNTTDEENYVPVKEGPTNFFKTPPIRDLIPLLEDGVNEEEYYDSKDGRGNPDRSYLATADPKGLPTADGMDPVLQREQGWRDGSNMLKANWQGSGGSHPPDPSGAAGIDHYVHAVNTTYRVYEKDGTPLTGSMGLNSLWPGSSNDGDPIVMYDRYADRWFISQFQTGSNEILIAVSETSDPLGSYYAYEYSFNSFPDYPKFGVWSTCYLMTANTSSHDCIVYERDKMLVGDPNAAKINMYFPNLNMYFNSIAPIYAEGLSAPDSTADCYAFAVQDNNLSGISTDHIKILKIHVDWDVPANSDITEWQELNTASFDSHFSPTGNWQDLSQPNESNKIDALSGFFMYKAQFRRFDGYDVCMLTHTVDVNGSNRAGVRWYELRMDAGSDQWYIYQQGTYNPNDGRHRWCGNAAMDLNGHIGLAYSCMGDGSGDYAGLRFTGRYDGDALGEMTVVEQEAINGDGAQAAVCGNSNFQEQACSARFGDYSQMTVDPADDATFWYTGEYFGFSGTKRTRIFSFAMWELLGEEEPPVSNPYFNSYQPSPNAMTVMWKDLNDDRFDILLTDLSGKIIAQENNVDATLGQMTFDIPSTAVGIYLVTLKGQNTQMTDKIWFAR